MFRLGVSRSLRVLSRLHPGIVRPSTIQATLLPIRFNSTSEVKNTISEVKDTISEVKNTLVSFSDESEKIISNLHSNEIGYLDSIGLAQGFGPTALMEKYLELTHVYSGLPWWSTIVVATVIGRIFLFPLYMSASANAAKLSKIKPEMDILLRDMKTAESNQEKYVLMQDRKKLMKDNDVTMYKQIYPLMQLPMAYGFFQALRKMSMYPVEGFNDEGYAWFHDLTQVDPYLGLHGLSAVVVLLLVRSGGEIGQSLQMNAPMKKILSILPFVSIIITKDFYASVMLYVVTNSVFSLLQTFTLKSAIFRKTFNMPPNVRPVVSATGTPAPETITEWFGQQKKSFDDQFETKTKTAAKKLEAQVVRRKNGVDGFIKRHDKK